MYFSIDFCVNLLPYSLFYLFEDGEEFLHGLGAEHADAGLAEVVDALEEW